MYSDRDVVKTSYPSSPPQSREAIRGQVGMLQTGPVTPAPHHLARRSRYNPIPRNLRRANPKTTFPLQKWVSRNLSADGACESEVAPTSTFRKTFSRRAPMV